MPISAAIYAFIRNSIQSDSEHDSSNEILGAELYAF